MNNNDLNSNLVSKQDAVNNTDINNQPSVVNQNNVSLIDNNQNIIQSDGNNLNNNEQILYDTSNTINDKPIEQVKNKKMTIKINSELKTAIVLALILLIAIMLIPKIFKLN